MPHEGVTLSGLSCRRQPPTTALSGYLEQAMEEMSFSGRAHDRIHKVALTQADLAETRPRRKVDSTAHDRVGNPQQAPIFSCCLSPSA